MGMWSQRGAKVLFNHDSPRCRTDHTTTCCGPETMSPEVELSWSQYVPLRSGLLVKFGILVQSSLQKIFTQSQPFFGLSLVWCHSRAGIFSRPSSSVKHRVTELNVLQRLPQSQHLTMKSWNERFVSDKPGATGRHVNVYQTKWLMGVYETVREPTLKQI